MNKLTFFLLASLILNSCGTISEDRSQEATQQQAPAMERKLISTLEVFDVTTKERREVFSADIHFEAPNWTPDGKYLIYNSKGRLYRLPVSGEASPEEIFTDFAVNCNNDHLVSSDGKSIAISHHEAGSGLSKIYTLPIEGGKPTLVTEKGPSYLHGWSPDGQTLTYCAERNGDYNIFTIAASGGAETQLTFEQGLDDGPEYSPDGKYIYFNSVRSGKMKIWRMNADGTDQTQVSPDDAYNDWFAHPSPDHQYLVFISYDETVAPGDHPPNKQVKIRMMQVGELQANPETLVDLFGGQGTINVPSWSPDSRQFAFVSYRFE